MAIGTKAEARREPSLVAGEHAPGALADRTPTMSAAALLALPGAATVFFSFHTGGFFAGTTAFGAVVVALLLVLRVTLSEQPFAGVGAAVGVAVGALALYAVWALVSTLWSDASARAVIEFDRVLLYGLALVLFGSMARDSDRVSWCLRALALGILAVCVAGFLTRTLPDVFPVELSSTSSDRLSYPIYYWNALGLLATLGLVLCLHLTCSEREPGWVRAAGAAALPVLGATLLLTFSRGAIAVAVVGLVAYVVLAYPRALLTGLVAAGPATAIAVSAAWDADLLAKADPTTPAAVAQGHDLALAVGLCALGAAALRAILVPVDTQVARIVVERRTRRMVLGAAAAALVVGALVTAAAVDLPDVVDRNYDRFVNGRVLGPADLRDRLSDPANNGRADQWNVALDGFREARLRGSGAGTYALTWTHERPTTISVQDAHSLYLEVLAELGIVGLVLLGVAVVTILGAFLVRMRGRDRHLYAALFSAGLTWALHAGLDLGWEIPAVTFWLFCLGGLALASPPSARRRREPRRLTRVVVSLGVLALAATPALVAVSQARLNDSLSAFRGRDCRRAIDSALGSVSALSVRPEPFEVLGYCDSRLGLDRLAIRTMRSAVDRDPDNWQYHYGLALVRASAGRDPRPEARRALELNPRGFLARNAVRRFRTADPRKWERRAESARLPIITRR